METTATPVKSTSFRTPVSVADAKRQLQKLARNIRKANIERLDAENANYSLGVRIADERLAELWGAVGHFESWLRSHS